MLQNPYDKFLLRGVNMLQNKISTALKKGVSISQIVRKNQTCLNMKFILFKGVNMLQCIHLCEKFYSMAIFSQNDEKTSLDYRNYNMEKPNRNIPFQLPLNIEKNLKLLMKEKNLNTGSLDLIYSRDGEFILLEINPVGQFSWLSENCNYNIEKKIAELLTK